MAKNGCIDCPPVEHDILDIVERDDYEIDDPDDFESEADEETAPEDIDWT